MLKRQKRIYSILYIILFILPLCTFLYTHASNNNQINIVSTPRVSATVLPISGFGTPSWLLDNEGRTWTNPIPLNTYVVFMLPDPLSHVLFQWMSSANYDYNTIRYGGPSSYEISYSTDSTNGCDGTWVTAVSITGNQSAARSHEIKAANIKWLRLRITSGTGAIDEIDIHDMSYVNDGAGSDTWGFIGDSITAFAFWRDASAGKAFNVLVNESDSSRYPSMMNLGIGSQNASHINNRIQSEIDNNPGIYFWAIGIGTNGNDSVTQFETYLRGIIQTVLDNKKQPIIARIPYTRDRGMDNRIQQYNIVIDNLTKEFGLTSGPDLYNAFKDNADSYFRDILHPNSAGINAINQLWAQTALSIPTNEHGDGSFVQFEQRDGSFVHSQSEQRDGSFVHSQEEQSNNDSVASSPSPSNSPSSTPLNTPIAPTELSFYVSGTRIYTNEGMDFVIRGVNINGPGWCFQRDTLQDVDMLIDIWQFNTVRLCAANKWDWFAASWNSDLEKIIDAFTKRGIVVILENHDYTGTYPSRDENGGYDYEGNYIEPLSHLKTWWKDKAERFKDNPYVWFNIMNEPSSANTQASANLWFNIHDEIIALIRETGAENIIVIDEHAWGQGGGYYYGPDSYDSAIITMGPALLEKYDNLVFSLHVYDAWENGMSRFKSYFQDAQDRGLCVILGEYGVMNNNNAQLSAVKCMFTYAIRYNIGRIYWAWDDGKLPMTNEGEGWRINRTDGTMPTNLTWVGRMIWLDNHRQLRTNMKGYQKRIGTYK
ncbi:MAG: cellulase family glycosylhydrolase [Oscillospiraceae bacterium]|nr:cellulase family glycosylhydrolase [Oscillospiraceae bacterium]